MTFTSDDTDSYSDESDDGDVVIVKGTSTDTRHSLKLSRCVQCA